MRVRVWSPLRRPCRWRLPSSPAPPGSSPTPRARCQPTHRHRHRIWFSLATRSDQHTHDSFPFDGARHSGVVIVQTNQSWTGDPLMIMAGSRDTILASIKMIGPHDHQGCLMEIIAERRWQGGRSPVRVGAEAAQQPKLAVLLRQLLAP